METLQTAEPQQTLPLPELIRELLLQLGENPDREGLRRTPLRVAKAFRELTSGYTVDIDRLINGALFTVSYHEMVLVKDMDFYSLCPRTRDECLQLIKTHPRP
ncbi:MAG: GTP cyclohydrolase I [Elusimicrobia bacterium]|nr:GTP cyclohydrolase I [Elusimicrobiota bacterium]